MKPHIVFLTAWYPDDHDPMFGLFVQKHAALLTSDFRVSVLHVTYYHDKGDGMFVSEKDQISVINLNIRTKNKILRWFYFLIAGLKAYRYIIRSSGRPKLNHVHILTRMGVLAAWIKCRSGIPYVVTEHWSRYFPVPGTYRNPIRKILTRYVCRRSAAMSAVSSRLETAMKSHGLGANKPWFRINNVVNDSVFVAADKTHSTKVRILNISCFEDKSKNLSGLVEAVGRLANEGIAVELVLGGTGQDFDKIRNLVQSLGLENQIHFTGLLTETQVAEWMRKSDIYLQPSHYENVPVVISEALLCGLPVVATRVGGLGEMIDESNGCLVEPGNSNDLYLAIKTMIENHKNYNPENIRLNALKKYSPDSVKKQILQLYSAVIK